MSACSPRSFEAHTRGHRIKDVEGGVSREVIAYNAYNGIETESWVIATIVIENPLLVVVSVLKLERYLDFREPIKALAKAFPIEGMQFVLHLASSHTELANDALVFNMSIPKNAQ